MKRVYIVTGVCEHLGNTVANLLASKVDLISWMFEMLLRH